MPLLICASTTQELAALFPDAAETPTREMQLLPARLKNREVLLCVTGVGPINAALAAGLCFARAEAENRPVRAVLNSGLAGAFDLRRLPLCSLCLAREEIWPEYGLHDGQSVTADAFSFPLWRRDDGTETRDRLPLDDPEVLGGTKATVFAECRSLTVAGVSASFARAQTLWNRYHADMENMEGFAVAYACARQGIPCVELRCIANKVGPRARDEKDFPGALNALAGILPALNLL
ncbi:MAG: futalosine hydrolase [Desulfovibrio sp.]|nr:futalosine hydrolase [Desulfovibrio sp.]